MFFYHGLEVAQLKRDYYRTAHIDTLIYRGIFLWLLELGRYTRINAHDYTVDSLLK